MTITVKPPSDCTPLELESFASLVIAGGEVQQNGLHQRIKNAFLLGFASDKGQMVSVAAIKYPSRKHAKDVFESSGSVLSPDDYPLEYGWAFTEKSHQNQGLGTAVLEQLLKDSGNRSMWATTRETNQSIHRILERHGFVRNGKPIRGRSEKLILWSRKKSTQQEGEAHG